MLVETSSGVYALDFKYFYVDLEQPSGPHGPKRFRDVVPTPSNNAAAASRGISCIIRDAKQVIVVHEAVRCDTRELFIKEKGRKKAITKALNSQDFKREFGLQGIKAIRTAFWKAYFARKEVQVVGVDLVTPLGVGQSHGVRADS